MATCGNLYLSKLESRSYPGVSIPVYTLLYLKRERPRDNATIAPLAELVVKLDAKFSRNTALKKRNPPGDPTPN